MPVFRESGASRRRIFFKRGSSRAGISGGEAYEKAVRERYFREKRERWLAVGRGKFEVGAGGEF